MAERTSHKQTQTRTRIRSRTCISIKLHIICLLCAFVWAWNYFCFDFKEDENKENTFVFWSEFFLFAVRFGIVHNKNIPYTIHLYLLTGRYCYCYSFNQCVCHLFPMQSTFFIENERKVENGKKWKEMDEVDLPRDRNVILDGNDFYRSTRDKNGWEKDTDNKEQKERISPFEWK